jgi:endonuclease/exonuclease/phosphatase family metal-dependent hydrolase
MPLWNWSNHCGNGDLPQNTSPGLFRSGRHAPRTPDSAATRCCRGAVAATTPSAAKPSRASGTAAPHEVLVVDAEVGNGVEEEVGDEATGHDRRARSWGGALPGSPAARLRRVPAVRMMTYNVRGGGRRGALRAVVAAAAPEVVVVNECPQIPIVWRWTCRSLVGGWGMTRIAGGRDGGRNLLCGVRYLEVRHTSAHRIPQPRLVDPIRGVVAAQLAMDDLPFGVVGCHLSLAADRRRRDLEIVLAAADRLEGPVVIAGDLNEEPGAPSWSRLARVGFVDHSCGEPTYPADRPVKRIDALLVRGEVRVTDHRVPDLRPGRFAASDHRPVVATLQW